MGTCTAHWGTMTSPRSGYRMGNSFFLASMSATHPSKVVSGRGSSAAIELSSSSTGLMGADSSMGCERGAAAGKRTRPWGEGRANGRRRGRGEGAALDVSADGNVAVLVLVDLGRVNVDVDDAGASRERLELSGHAVIKADTECLRRGRGHSAGAPPPPTP